MERHGTRVAASLEAENTRPLWQREPSQADALLNDLAASPLGRMRYKGLLQYMGMVLSIARQWGVSAMYRDGLVAAITLERYYRQYGAWVIFSPAP